MRRPFLAILAASALALAACADQTPTAAPAAPRATQAALDVSCVTTGTATYTPGLLLTPQTVTVDAGYTLAPCVSGDPTLTSGTVDEGGTGTRSCLDLAASRSGTSTIHWNNGQTSTFRYDLVVNNVAGQLVLVATGTVTAGLFAGSAVVRQSTQPAVNVLDCLQPPGITRRSGAGVFEIL